MLKVTFESLGRTSSSIIVFFHEEKKYIARIDRNSGNLKAVEVEVGNCIGDSLGINHAIYDTNGFTLCLLHGGVSVRAIYGVRPCGEGWEYGDFHDSDGIRWPQPPRKKDLRW